VRLLAAALVALALAAPALASEAHPTLNEMEGEVMCPICHTTLDQSSSAAAQRIKAFIVRRIRAGDTKSEIEDRLVADFGPSILAQPPKKGFDLLAWVLPLGGIAAGALALAGGAWAWSRNREGAAIAPDGPPLDPALARRVDEELAKFDA
jgi:cytochrome c-type biogenesis protein CcmH